MTQQTGVLSLSETKMICKSKWYFFLLHIWECLFNQEPCMPLEPGNWGWIMDKFHSIQWKWITFVQWWMFYISLRFQKQEKDIRCKWHIYICHFNIYIEKRGKKQNTILHTPSWTCTAENSCVFNNFIWGGKGKITQSYHTHTVCC